jgi:hypothetical protein
LGDSSAALSTPQKATDEDYRLLPEFRQQVITCWNAHPFASLVAHNKEQHEIIKTRQSLALREKLASHSPI